MSGGYSCPRHVYCGLSLGDALVTATRHVTPRSRERNSEILAEISDHGVWNLVHLCQGRDAAPTQGNQFPGINRPCMYFVRLFVSVAESPSLCLFGLKPSSSNHSLATPEEHHLLSWSRLQINKRWTRQRPQFAPPPPLMHATLPRWHVTGASKIQGYRAPCCRCKYI
jgi:hypothetical protein